MSTYGQVIEALGDPTRRAVFERLGKHPMAVGELAAGMPVSRPAVSQHLRVLKDAGLVSERREGTRRIYGIAPEGLAEVRAYFEQFWDGRPRRVQGGRRERRDMSSTETIAPIKTAVTVAVSPERAWEVFTAQMADWWPLHTHSIAAFEGSVP